MYRFANKYGANVDGYSPIYTPDTWSETGSEYKLGTKGLLAWCAVPAALVLCFDLVCALLKMFPHHVRLISEATELA